MILGNKIKKLRELKNLTQEHMATALGMNQSAYSKIESGASDVSFTKLEKIASVLGLKLEDVLSFNEQMVFNVMNNQTGNGLVINNSISENEKVLYIEQINSLKEEVVHLKKILDKVLTAK
jgi:transcriptional regulator with XRE-family HTH domain